jgi:hypothetical protein
MFGEAVKKSYIEGTYTRVSMRAREDVVLPTSLINAPICRS